MVVTTPGFVVRTLPVQFSLAGLALLLAGLPARAQGLNNMRDQLIIHYCTLAVNADFAKAGKPVPAGLAKDTCTCVAEQVMPGPPLPRPKPFASSRRWASTASVREMAT